MYKYLVDIFISKKMVNNIVDKQIKVDMEQTKGYENKRAR